LGLASVERLAQSIERCGQIVPCIVVAAPDGDHNGALLEPPIHLKLRYNARLSLGTATTPLSAPARIPRYTGPNAQIAIVRQQTEHLTLAWL